MYIIATEQYYTIAIESKKYEKIELHHYFEHCVDMWLVYILEVSIPSGGKQVDPGCLGGHV